MVMDENQQSARSQSSSGQDSPKKLAAGQAKRRSQKALIKS